MIAKSESDDAAEAAAVADQDCTPECPAEPALAPPVQKRLFPNCTYSTASTSWIICNNNWGKSIGRTRDIEAMNHHINDLKEGANRLKPSSALRMHHHTIRSLEDAQIKVRAAVGTEKGKQSARGGARLGGQYHDSGRVQIRV